MKRFLKSIFILALIVPMMFLMTACSNGDREKIVDYNSITPLAEFLEQVQSSTNIRTKTIRTGNNLLQHTFTERNGNITSWHFIDNPNAVPQKGHGLIEHYIDVIETDRVYGYTRIGESWRLNHINILDTTLQDHSWVLVQNANPIIWNICEIGFQGVVESAENRAGGWNYLINPENFGNPVLTETRRIYASTKEIPGFGLAPGEQWVYRNIRVEITDVGLTLSFDRVATTPDGSVGLNFSEKYVVTIELGTATVTRPNI